MDKRSLHPILPTRDGYGPPPQVQLGMTIREHYAGLAMQALIINNVPISAEEIASRSFMMADMMIEASRK